MVEPKGSSWRVLRRSLALSMAVIVALAAFDVLSGSVYRVDARASVELTAPLDEPAHTLLVFPGYAADCKAISEAFRPVIDHKWTMIVLCYAERGVDDQQILSLLGPYLTEAPTGSVSVLAGSMGGMVASTFLENFARAHPGSRPGVRLFLDTSPARAALVKVPSAAFWLSHCYRGGVLSSLVWYLLNGTPDRPAMEPEASVGVVERGEEYTRGIGLPALTSQAQYIDGFRLDKLVQFPDMLGSATAIQASGAAADPLVWVKESTAEWSKYLPGLQVRVIGSRQGSWHVPWTQRPREVLEVVSEAVLGQ